MRVPIRRAVRSSSVAVAMKKVITTVAAAVLAVAACTDAADSETTEPGQTTVTEVTVAPTGSTEAGGAVAGGTIVAEHPLVVVNWSRAAQTSAEGLELEVAPLRMTVPAPSGWQVVLGWAVLRHGAVEPAGAGITFDRPLALYADRCAWDDPDGLLVIGPTVDDLVAALVDNPQYAATNVRDVVVDGFAGKEFEMMGAPPGLDLTTCSGGRTNPGGSSYPHLHRPWAGRYLMGPSEMNVVRVVDVGGERVVIRAVFFPDTSEDDLAQLFEMLESIRIEPLP
jgi:hypothetical protein